MDAILRKFEDRVNHEVNTLGHKVVTVGRDEFKALIETTFIEKTIDANVAGMSAIEFYEALSGADDRRIFYSHPDTLFKFSPTLSAYGRDANYVVAGMVMGARYRPSAAFLGRVASSGLTAAYNLYTGGKAAVSGNWNKAGWDLYQTAGENQIWLQFGYSYAKNRY